MEKKPNIYRTRQSSHNYFRGIKQKKNQMEYVRFVCRLYRPKCGPSCPSIAEYGNPGLTIATAGYHCRLLFSYAHSSKKDPQKKKSLVHIQPWTDSTRKTENTKKNPHLFSVSPLTSSSVCYFVSFLTQQLSCA
uniref:Uncharacterized protein n=1 Tax=Trypanosoma congolense (strain IL3000) TaxID=1068625 RepID=G0USR1_TRYCI|nr:hypothetical protein, unlikely [Trypanosoma congolense IL3000]